VEIFMSIINIVSVSGGKDSTATLLLALERQEKNIRAVFADTGHEHDLTYKYVDYLEHVTGVEIQRVKADFSAQIARKREFAQSKWPEHGVPDSHIQAALDVLHPTGNPFLDMCIWKGRFPSSRARFCTEELKVLPIHEQVYWPILRETDDSIESWQGIRWDESDARSTAVEREGIEPDASRVFAYRPILAWSADDVFAMHAKHGIEPNPLYKQGMGRVGCMPCINCTKGELAQIAKRFPDVVDKLRRWEAIVSKAAKRQSGTFFCATNDPTVKKTDNIHYTTHGIERMVQWAMTERGGRQQSLIHSATDFKQCSSIYGLCE
jgi:3'-phosphoadenosine 5'-phosphosulfate sulfotransferase (PAPS reductase)/FAD synthetase